MKTSKEGMKLLKEFEGLKLKPYLCSARVPTIGIGSTYYPDGKKVTMQDPSITEDRAYEILATTIRNYEAAVNKYVKSTINQNQFDALVSLCYNIGPGSFAKSSVVRFVNADPNAENVATAFRMWNKAGGKIVKGLVTRREKEIAYYFK